jgi:2-(1,2-epoxy-1,2-dihydrophenyl)acetyl-CoA isomerase
VAGAYAPAARLDVRVEDAVLRLALADEAFAMELSSRSPDFREGLKAFAERRSPAFTGR